MCISRKGMLVTLNMSRWGNTKRDKSASDETCTRAGAEVEVGLFTKRLLESSKMRPITTIESRARNAVYHYSMPWLDSGVRLLPAELYVALDRKLVELKRQHEDAVASLLDEYDDLVAAAPARLQGLFCASDYPSRDTLQRKFSFEFSYLPVPEGGDFRLDSSRADLDRLKAQYDEQTHKREAELSAGIARRVAQVAANFASKIVPGKVFRDNVGGELREMADIINGLNVLNDPRIAEIASELKVLCDRVNPQELRDDKNSRGKVLADTDALRKKASQIGGWF